MSAWLPLSPLVPLASVGAAMMRVSPDSAVEPPKLVTHPGVRRLEVRLLGPGRARAGVDIDRTGAELSAWLPLVPVVLLTISLRLLVTIPSMIATGKPSRARPHDRCAGDQQAIVACVE